LYSFVLRVIDDAEGRPGATSGVPRNFFFWGGGVSTNSVEDRENGDLGVVAP